MARRPGGSDDDVSLFPFLSIIACVIGVLTLMIATVSLAQMDNSDVALIEAYENATNAATAEQAKLLELKKLLDEKIGPVAALTRNQIDATSREMDTLLKQLETVHQELEKQKGVKIVIPTLDPAQRESMTSMQGELKSVAEQIAQLEKDLTGRQDIPPANVTILPTGTGVNFVPHFVECTASTLVMHDFDPPRTIRTGEMVKDKDFIKILETVANSVNDTVIFLIRSDGLGTYYAARNLCNERSIRNGKLPVVGNGKINLSRFAGTAK